jgi:hypothetical protein
MSELLPVISIAKTKSSRKAIFLLTFVLISQNRLGKRTERRSGLEMETGPEDVLAEIHRLQAIESSKVKDYEAGS